MAGFARSGLGRPSLGRALAGRRAGRLAGKAQPRRTAVAGASPADRGYLAVLARLHFAVARRTGTAAGNALLRALVDPRRGHDEPGAAAARSRRWRSRFRP